ncbi:MAG: hypothetical protein WAT09_11200 [Paracoccaceae bacterium]
MKRRVFAGMGLAALAGSALALWRSRPAELSDPAFAALFAQPLVPPEAPVAVYHLGHSLVGRDMPAMLAQLGGHVWNSQLGWGASLKNHWQGDVPGLAEENRAPVYRPAGQAVDSGAYPVLVLTEMVDLRDAIRWHDSAAYLAAWASRARAANPEVRIYLYETWPRLDVPEGWAVRVATDRQALWQDQVLRPAVAQVGVIHVIPGGQVMAAVVAAAEAGDIPGLAGQQDLFSDQIHFTDLGAWLMAMVHFAVIYGRSPLGLPVALQRADGTLAPGPAKDAALLMQALVWRVVTGYALTGVTAGLDTVE